MKETSESLQSRRHELLDALRVLEQDREDGVVDEDAYQATRLRYESEAARMSAQLDQLPPEDARPVRGARSARWMAIPAGALVLAAIGLLLFSALQHRGIAQSVTGNVPTVAPLAPAALKSAQREAAAHPRSVDAQLALGNAYLDAGQTAKADGAYQVAMRLAPTRPQARTLHAMIVGANGHNRTALTLLKQVEQRTPTYARAWLLDGLIASKLPHGSHRAMAAWRRFLVLQPHSSLSPTVRKWIKSLEKTKQQLKSR